MFAKTLSNAYVLPNSKSNQLLTMEFAIVAHLCLRDFHLVQLHVEEVLFVTEWYLVVVEAFVISTSTTDFVYALETCKQ